MLTEECQKLGFSLGATGTYGVGMLFAPKDETLFLRVLSKIQNVVQDEGQFLLGVRDVPIDVSAAGKAAREDEPRILQVFVGPGTLAADDAALDRKLYVIRRRIENECKSENLGLGDYPYFASFSTRTIVYKGLLQPEQLARYYRDLSDTRAITSHAIVHQRFSTNTFPSWSRAHPYRRIAHNGEINTLRGNVQWMASREPVLRAAVFGEDVQKLLPIIDTSGSDSAQFDDVLELLVHTGRSLPHALMMMIPEAWEKDASMPAEKRAFYAYHACIMEPWDGPACITFSDGRYVGATLDRNGLRPARHVTTKDGLVVMASETGVLPIEADNVIARGRLQPGRMFVVDTHRARIVDDEEMKHAIAERRPYARWVESQLLRLKSVQPPTGTLPPPMDPELTRTWQRALAIPKKS